MLTYVINTSENKTFDSDRLFDLAGYSKIRWLNCALSDVRLCAEEIFEKQNVLGADTFRIAVLVDFYGYDRIRVPYGRLGFGPEAGVDISLYMPYIEAYLMDNLIAYLENRELYTSDFEVYYVQNTRIERYEVLDNLMEQTRAVLEGGNEVGKLDPPKKKKEVLEDLDTDDQKKKKPKAKKDPKDPKDHKDEEEEDDEEKIPPEDLVLYDSFRLYCTPTLSLNFDLKIYPYGATEMTFPQFFRAFRERMGYRPMLRRYYYVTSYGGGKARSAFDTLSLSLYLIRMYEREEMQKDEGEIEIEHLDVELLKDVLVNAWVKISLASEIAKGNDSQYFALRENLDEGTIEERNPLPTLESIPLVSDGENRSVEEMYEKICYFAERSPEQIASDHREEFNGIMDAYLDSRDETRESSVEEEFENRIQNGTMKMTTKSPSKNDYRTIVEEKQQNISEIFTRVLDADYIATSFDEEKKRADKVYKKYKLTKACLTKQILGDIVFAVIALLAVLVPYAVLQLSGYALGTFDVMMLAVHAGALFGGLYVLAIFLRVMPLIAQLRKTKREMRVCYAQALRREQYSMSQIRHRYEVDLLEIECERYRLRQLRRLYEANAAKDRNVEAHRDMLRDVKDRVAGILNNLDVEPVLDPNESVEGEFDLSKPISARENGVYRIFSVETIERLFPRKGRDTH